MNIAEKRGDAAGMVQARRAVDGPAPLRSWLPQPDFSGSIYSETSRNFDSAELLERAKALEAENLRLQALVCHLLRENEQLRNRNPRRDFA